MCSYNNQVWLYHNLDLTAEIFDEDEFLKENNLHIVKGSKYNQITETLKKTNNQCPCIPKYAWNNDTVCICKEFLNSSEIGECRCGRYKKIEV